jgi:hypothetical protein
MAKLEETVKHQVEDILVTLDDRTQETQAEIKATKVSADTKQ